MQLTSQLLLLSSAAIAAAEKHHLFVGAYSRPVLFSLEFDTTANTLRATSRIPAHSGHPWLSFSHDRKTLYGAEKDGWASYSVDGSQSIRFQSNLTLTSSCPNDKGDPLHGRTSVLAEAKPPYNVFGSARRACGTVISTNPDGSLNQVLQNINYGANSRIHGMVTDPNSDYVYSADEKGNGIWVHQIEPSTGALVPLAFQAFPVANASPRRLVLSASSRYLYVLLSKLTAVGVYEVNGPELRYTGVNYTIVPEGANPNFYKGHDILLSADKDIIYASARYRSSYNPAEDTDSGYDEQDEDTSDKDNAGEDDEQRRRYVHDTLRDRHLQLAEKFESKFANDTKVNPVRRAKAAGTPPGYVTAIQLMTADPEPSDPSYGYVSAGWPIDVILQVPTSTSGGKSNALVPAPWGNEYFAVTDSDKGFVQVWKITGLQSLIRSKVTVLPKNMPGWNLHKRQDPNAAGPFLGDLLKPAAPSAGGYQPAGQGQTDPNPQPQFQSSGPQDPNTAPSQYPNAPQYVYPSADPNAPPQQQPQGQDPNQPGNNPGLTIVVQAPPQQQQQQPAFDPYQPQSQPQPPPGSSYQPVFAGNPQPGYSQPQYPPQQNYPPPSYQAPPPAPAPAPASVRPDPEDMEGDNDDQLYNQSKSGRPGYTNAPSPQPSTVTPPAAEPRAPGLLTGLLGGLLGGQKSSPGLADGLLGTNGGYGLLGGGGLLGLGILKKRDNVNVLSPEFVQAKAMVRASVIAEWRAPVDVVARPNEDDVEARRKMRKQKFVVPSKRMSAVERRQYRDPADFDNFGNPEDEEIDLDEVEGDGSRTANPASRLPRVKTYNSEIPAGRGCCANAVWFD